MKTLETLLDVKESLTSYLSDFFKDEITNIVGYGSFFQQDLTKKLENLSLYDFEDRKPDFIIIVGNHEQFYQKLGELLNWKKGLVNKNVSLNKNSINYYHLETPEEYKFITKEKEGEEGKNFIRENLQGIKFKIGVVSISDLERLSFNDFYVSGRLSKMNYILYNKTENDKEKLEKIISRIRKRFTKVAFELQSGIFDYEKLLKTYIKTSYLAEIYRYLTIDRKKTDKIYNSVVVKEGKIITMKDFLRNELDCYIKEYIYENPAKVNVINDDFFIVYNTFQDRICNFGNLLFSSFNGAGHSIKNLITNTHGNDASFNPASYLKRKFRKMNSE